MPRPRPTVALAALTAAGALTAGVLVAAPAPAASPSAASASVASGLAAAAAPAAPAFLLPSSARTSSVPAPRQVQGQSTLVTLDTSVLPQKAAGQRIGFTLGKKTVTGTFDSAESHRLYSSWTGSFDGGAEGAFAIAKSGDVVRGTLSTSEGTYAITQAEGDQYWLTATTPHEVTEDDVLTASPADLARAEAAPAVAEPAVTDKRRKGKSKVTVAFAYTKATKAAVGSKDGFKAIAGLIVAQTNASLKNSKVKVKLKLRGVTKTKGTEVASSSKNTQRLRNPRNGTFDSALRYQRKKRADLIHLITNVPPTSLCGAAYMPVNPAQATRRIDLSQGSTHLQCVDDLSPVHELGHNLGADHLVYPGITHDSKIKGNVAYADPAHGFVTIMSYFTPCYVQNIQCTRIPFYSNKKTTFNGLPVGSKDADNAKAMKKIGPRVARYR